MSSSESAVRPLEMDVSVQLEPPPTVAGFDLTRFDLDFWDVVDATGRDGLLETTALEIFRSTGLVMDDAEASTRAQSGERASWCGASTFKRWIRAVDNGYFDKAYHNSVHAADVIVTSNCYLEQLKILPQGRLPPPLSGGHGEGSTAFAIAPELVTEWRLAHLALLMASAVHDIRHPGRMNPFMMATKHALAAEFPGRAGILEAMHAKTAMEVIMRQSKWQWTPAKPILLFNQAWAFNLWLTRGSMLADPRSRRPRRAGASPSQRQTQGPRSDRRARAYYGLEPAGQFLEGVGHEEASCCR